MMKKTFIFFALVIMLGISVVAYADSKLAQIQQAAQQGDGDAQFDLGMMYYFGDGVDQDLDLARKWLEKAAKQGIAVSKINNILSEIDSLQSQRDQLNELIRQVEEMNAPNRAAAHAAAEKEFIETQQAAQQGDGEAQLNLAWMYFDGEGVETDYILALQWSEKAAKQGVPQAGFLMRRAQEEIDKQTVAANRAARQASNKVLSASDFQMGMTRAEVAKVVGDLSVANRTMGMVPTENHPFVEFYDSSNSGLNEVRLWDTSLTVYTPWGPGTEKDNMAFFFINHKLVKINTGITVSNYSEDLKYILAQLQEQYGGKVYTVKWRNPRSNNYEDLSYYLAETANFDIVVTGRPQLLGDEVVINYFCKNFNQMVKNAIDQYHAKETLEQQRNEQERNEQLRRNVDGRL